jgi:hypothetical protein
MTRKHLVIIVKAGCLDPETFLKNREARHEYMSTRHYHQQQLVHQHVSLLQNNYTLNVTLKIKPEEQVSSRCIVDTNLDTISGRKTRISDIHFLLCQSCFWCASYTSPFLYKRMTKETITKCPSCNEENIESLPIAENEKYGFDYDTKRGVIMEFFR